MARSSFSDGISIDIPDGFKLAEEQVAGKARGGKLKFSGAVKLKKGKTDDNADDPVIDALKDSDMELHRKLIISATPELTARLRGSTKEKIDVGGDAVISVDVSEGEDAVVLIEQDGMYLWQYPDEALRGSSVKRSFASGSKLYFSIPLHPATGDGYGKRDIFGQIIDFGVGKIKAYILKFIAGITVDLAMRMLEKDITPRLISIRDTLPEQWKVIGGVADLNLPEDRKPKLLLFVHGTFSSTIGAFGVLGGTPWGEELLKSCIQDYDAVLGFDHLTLKEDPLENARQFLAFFKAYKGMPVSLDIVTHSRGGLVVRSMAEKLIPLMKSSPVDIERVIFVGATNGGTLLAEPSNWKDMIDLYTNMIVGTSKAIGMIAPQVKAASLVLNEVVKIIGSFVKYCAVSAVDEARIPGLSAMEPDGAFVTDINLLQDGQQGAEKSYYCTITSDFAPSLKGDHEPKEFSKRLLLLLAGGFIGKLMKGAANDMVVNTASMSAIDVDHGDFIKQRYDFGKNSQVYHTNYFIRPEVTNALARWLELKPVVPVEEISQDIIVEVEKARFVKSKPFRSFASMDYPHPLGPKIDTDIISFNTSGTVSDLGREVSDHSPSYVVFTENNSLGETLNYAIKGEDVLGMINLEEDISVQEAFGLDDKKAATTLDVAGNKISKRSNLGFALNNVKVVIEEEKPVGVVPEEKPVNIEELSRIALEIKNPADDQAKILRKRNMPSFKQSPAHFEESPVGAAAPANPVVCQVRAEMDEFILVEKLVPMTVTISRDDLAPVPAGTISEAGVINADESLPLIISVFAYGNISIMGRSVEEVTLPAAGSRKEVYFNLKASGEGKGEIWVLVRQVQIPMLKLILAPQALSSVDDLVSKISAEKPAIEPQAPSKPLNTLWIEDLGGKSKVAYSYQLYSQGLKISKTFLSKPIVGNPLTYVNALYKKIEDRWIYSSKARLDFQQELRAFGLELLNELIPADLQKILWEKRGLIDSIQVISQEPFIPWELIHLRDPDTMGEPGEVCFLGQLGLIRWIAGAGDGWPTEQIKIRKGKALYVIPEYEHAQYKLPEAQKEIPFLQRVFDAKAAVPTSSEVRNLISVPGQFDLLHFACHGQAKMKNISEAMLLMKGFSDTGNDEYVLDPFTESVAQSFGNLQAIDNFPMVVLNACQSGRAGYKLTEVGGFAKAFISRGAGAFVGSMWSVGDFPAMVFTESLYEELISGKTLAEATKTARETARQSQDATWLSYVVYGHPHMTISVV